MQSLETKIRVQRLLFQDKLDLRVLEYSTLTGVTIDHEDRLRFLVVLVNRLVGPLKTWASKL